MNVEKRKEILKEFSRFEKYSLDLSEIVNVDGKYVPLLDLDAKYDLYYVKTYVWIKCKKYQKHNVEKLPPNIGMMKKIETIKIQNKELDKIPRSVCYMKDLKDLDLTGNKISDISPLVDEQREISESEIAEVLYGNNKNDPIEILNPEDYGLIRGPTGYLDRNQLTNLKYLDLSKCQISDVKTLFHSPLKNLVDLKLSSNNISEIPECDPTMTNLTFLKLSSNKLMKLPKFINSFSRLMTLDISSNPISEINLEGLNKLSLLHIQGCKFAEFPKSVLGLFELNVLDISDNDIAEIPEEIGNLKDLHYFYLRNTKIREWPKTMSELKKIEKINFKDTELKSLYENFPQMSDEVKRLYGMFGVKFISEEKK